MHVREKDWVIIGDSQIGIAAADALEATGERVVGLFRSKSLPDVFPWKYLGRPEESEEIVNEATSVFIATESSEQCQRLRKYFSKSCFPHVIHPKAVIGSASCVEDGAFIGAGAVIGAGVTIGAHAVIEAGCIIGAGTVIGDASIIRSGVTIGYNVTVGAGCYIGAGAILKDGITIGENKIVQTGDIVVKDMVLKMVYKRGAWIYAEDGPENRQ